jgi:S-adenosylmethionine synthetase
MFEKVNPFHPDKVADRIAGAIVDLAYEKAEIPRIAVEVLIGHGRAMVMIEGSTQISISDVESIVERLSGIEPSSCNVLLTMQDIHLAENQYEKVRCGDNGIFKGIPVTDEQQLLTDIAHEFADSFKSDGKYIISKSHTNVKTSIEPDLYDIIVCQSNAEENEIQTILDSYDEISKKTINPLGFWTGGTDVDCGATNRKLGSDMGDGVIGGGLHGKDLSKADVSVNIMCHLLAQQEHEVVTALCAIGDTWVTFNFQGGKKETLPYSEVVKRAKEYIQGLGGFERFAEYGLIR